MGFIEAAYLLAHSAPCAGADPDSYARHVEGVRIGARERAEAMLAFAGSRHAGLAESIETAAVFHDLGKLDPDTQSRLQIGRGEPLYWNHIDAGVAHVSARRNWMAAWLIRSHHAPGLPDKTRHFNPDRKLPSLRGARRDTDPERDLEQVLRTDGMLDALVASHERVAGQSSFEPRRATHGLTMRLALSCLADADHTDTAFFDTGFRLPPPIAPRWEERSETLRRFVSQLPEGETEDERSRNRARRALFEACDSSTLAEPLASCEASVGMGKTTAIAAYLLRRCAKMGLRRMFVIAPFTNIITQTASRLREALILPGEREIEHEVVAEHHHRVEPHDRALNVLWRAPIIVTTAVAFFETLASCNPTELRKLHALPGSAILVDEAHAALPIELWAQNWRWLVELATEWSCPVVLSSGSQVRFWEHEDIVSPPQKLQVVGSVAGTHGVDDESRRVRFKTVDSESVLTIEQLVDHSQSTPGPRLVILNTVQNAAVVASEMLRRNLNVLHLSSALTPADRARILAEVSKRLESERNWTLVATSIVEAGVDLSFRTGFRERFSVASLIQTGGRVNRHGEYTSSGGSVVFDFDLIDHETTRHPAASRSSPVLKEFLRKGYLESFSPAEVVTRAMRQELLRMGASTIGQHLLTLERTNNYPEVREKGRVISTDMCLVVIDEELKRKLCQPPRASSSRVSYREILSGSVQLWATRISALKLPRLGGRDDMYEWPYRYDPDSLGYMAGVLDNRELIRSGVAII